MTDNCCQDPTMGEHACTDKSQCFEPCGDLGHSLDTARVSPNEYQNSAIGLEMTHGFEVRSSIDNTDRSVTVVMLEDGSYGVTIVTDWPSNEDKSVTRIRLSPPGMALLFDALAECVGNMAAYEIKKGSSNAVVQVED